MPAIPPHRSGQTKPCATCGVTITRMRNVSEKSWVRKRFCSHSCRAKATPPENRVIPEPRRGEANHGWKGDTISYGGLHDYLRYTLPRPSHCQWCGAEGRVELANLGVYDRNPENWAHLCKTCHKRFDNERRPESEKACARCGAIFLTKFRHRKYCSEECGYVPDSKRKVVLV